MSEKETPPKGEKDPQVIVEKQEPQKTVEIPLDGSKEVRKPEPQDFSLSFEELKRMESRIGYQARQLEKRMKDMEALANQSLKPQAQEQKPTDDLDEIANQDWKKAVKILGKEAAKEYFAELQQQNTVEATRRESELELEKSRKLVLSRYPNIENESTEEYKTYVEVVNEDPQLLRNPRGPEIAMYRMEQKLMANGKVPAAVKNYVEPKIDEEVNRRARVGAVSATPKAPVRNDNVIVLTQDEKEFCETRGIPFGKYAEMRKISKEGYREGVSV